MTTAKDRFFIGLAVLAFAVSIAIGGMFAWFLVLRTAYKEDAYKINESFRTNSTLMVCRGEESLEAVPEEMEYYNKFLLDAQTLVFSRKAVPVTDSTITLDFGSESLSFTGIEDGTAIGISWKSREGEKNYIVRSATSFNQLTAYYSNYKRQKEAGD